MNARVSINDQRRGASPSKEPSLRAVPPREPLQLVKTLGQVQIHTSTFRGSSSIVLSEALRSAGLGSKVLISQFLRGGVNQGPNGAINLCGRLEWLRPAIETCLPEQSQEEDLSLKRSIDKVYWNKQFGEDESNRDSIALDLLEKNNIKVEPSYESVVHEPGSLKTGKGTPYSVFTPFKRKWIENFEMDFLDIDFEYQQKISSEITSNIKDKAMGKNVLISVSPGQLLTKIVADELTDLMGGESAELSLDGNPNLILLSGLQGSGKTTFCGKLGRYLTNKGKKTLMVACDVYRPAAIEQLHVIGDDLKIEVFSDKKSKSPLNIAKKAIQHAKSKGFKSVIIDTAGRLAIDEEMMKEIKGLKSNLKPQETLFVVDSMIGQDAVLTAKTFNEAIDYDGVVLTKLDGDSRGGSALSIRKVVNKPIKFISTGEKMDALDVFHPDRMAKRILGMGDVISLVERAQQNFDEEEARKLQKKMFENTFGLDDFLSQIQKIKKMGNIKDLIVVLSITKVCVIT